MILLRFSGHLWRRRSDGSSSSAESMSNNGATALGPLTPSASARHGNDENKQKHKRRKRQDVLAVLSSGGAEPGLVSTTLLELCLPSNAKRRHWSHAGLFSGPVRTASELQWTNKASKKNEKTRAAEAKVRQNCDCRNFLLQSYKTRK